MPEDICLRLNSTFLVWKRSILWSDLSLVLYLRSPSLFSVSFTPRSSAPPPHFSIREGMEVKHDNEAFFYFRWPNRSRLLNTGWERRIKRRSRQAGGCCEMEVKRSFLRGTKQKRPIIRSPRVPPFFIISNIAFCLSSSLPPLKSLLPVPLSLWSHSPCVSDKLFSHLRSCPFPSMSSLDF